MTSAVHFIIPDTQVTPDSPTEHLYWIAQEIVEHAREAKREGRPFRVIHLGDHWDMHSLSGYDKGSKSHHDARYSEDVEAGNVAIRIIDGEARRTRLWRWIDWYILRGNHEDRIRRAIEKDYTLDGALSFDHLISKGWEVVPFLEPLSLDGVQYAHFWYNPLTGKTLGGLIDNKLKTVGHTFIQGHVQTYQTAVRYVGSEAQRALIAGACYLHDENYKGPQGNAHWRGCFVLHNVKDGNFDLEEISLDRLCQKYEGITLDEYITQHGRRWYGL